MKALRLSEIWIYPIKSLGGIPLETGKVLGKGLLHDRRWMLITHDGEFMTQREHPQMALLQPYINDVVMTVNQKDNPATKIKFQIDAPPSGKKIETKIWNDTVQVIEVDTKLSAWFSDQLSVSCKLVVFPEGHARPVDPNYKVNDEHVSLADAFPFLIIGQSSLNDLNTRLDQPVPMNRFRPNFVFTGGDPFEEDGWKNFSIGGVNFVGVKLCARCPIPTINQDTGVRGAEPLLTLSKFRKTDNKVLFGQNLVATNQGEVKVGDLITLR